ncbi:MAG TPA: hypothetical protein VKC62_07325 [Gaiellaceae bacterium]|nr:hypothetical protein [Gaiellaceae bacterium]
MGIAIGYFDTADCSGLPSSTDSSPIADATSTSWQAVSTVVTPPVGTVAAEVFLAAIKAAPSDPSIDALFDRVFLGDSALIAADDFEIGETCRWSATSP